MPVYVAEISGNPVMAFVADTQEDATSYLTDEWFMEDIKVLKSPDGSLPWDGQSPITARPATEEETNKWQEARKIAITEGDIDEEEDASEFSHYLVEVTEED
jgi:hypothetical protein